MSQDNMNEDGKTRSVLKVEKARTLLAQAEATREQIAREIQSDFPCHTEVEELSHHLEEKMDALGDEMENIAIRATSLFEQTEASLRDANILLQELNEKYPDDNN